jgi:ABC-2 type transport system permease protein
MRGVGTLSRALLLGFIRDRIALFFTILFPLLFLVLFGAIFTDNGPSPIEVRQVGAVPLLDQLPPDAREQIGRILEIQRTDDRPAAIQEVRDGDIAAAIEQQGDRIIVHYSAASAVTSGTVLSVLNSLIQQANLAAAGATPRFELEAQQVEDDSLQAIQYVTPGILGWAIASSGVFGAAFTLVQWRQKKLLRRLRLSPVGTPAIVTARVAVSMGLALLQTAIFLGLATAFFGLTLSAYWWMSIPVVLVGTLAFLAIGLVAGAVAKTAEAANLIANLVVLPMAFLSGAFIPLEFSPKWIQTIANIFPLKHLVTAMQDVMVRGKGPLSVLPEMGILLAFAAVLTTIALFAFRWDDV